MAHATHPNGAERIVNVPGIGSNGYDTAAVMFGNQNATLTVWPGNSKGESLQIAVS